MPAAVAWHGGEVCEPLLPYLRVLMRRSPPFQLQRSPRRRAGGRAEAAEGQVGLGAVRASGLGLLALGQPCAHAVLAPLEAVGPRLPPWPGGGGCS